MSSGFSIKTLETKAVVPNRDPTNRVRTDELPYHAPNMLFHLIKEASKPLARCCLMRPENASVLIFRLYSLLLAVLQIPGAANPSSHSSVMP